MKRILLLHLMGVFGSLLPIPIGNIILPYVYWRLNRKAGNEPFSKQACNILNFQLPINLLISICCIGFWYHIAKTFSIGNYNIDNTMLLLIVIILVVVNILYPIAVVVRMKVTNNVRMYNPTIIPFFRYEKCI